MKRRKFLGALATVTGAALLGPACKIEPKASPAPAKPPPDVYDQLTLLTREEARTMEAVLDRLLPRDTQTAMPGASDLDVVVFVDRTFAAKEWDFYRKMFRDGLRYLDKESRKRHAGKRFRDLGVAEQDALLADFQSGRVNTKFPTARWFTYIHTFALEGYWGDPIHGGNRDKLAWSAVGFIPGCPTPSGSCSD